MNIRGGAEAIFVLAIIPFIVVAFFGVWIFVNQTITDTLTNIEASEGVNVSAAAEVTFGQVQEGLNYLRLIAFVIFFGLVLSFLLINAFVKAHPFLYVVYVLVSMFATILSVYLSNFYSDKLLTMPTIGTTFQSFTVMNFVMANLPLLIGTIGILGGILLFINLPRDGGLAMPI